MAFSLDQFYQLNRRALIWAIFFGLLWLLRDFFSLVFLSFVLVFLALPLTEAGQRWLRLPYRLSLTIVYVLFLGAVIGFVSYVTPNVIREANSLVGRLGEIQATLLEVKSDFTEKYPALQRPLSGFMRGMLDEESRQRVDERLGREARGLGLAPDVIAKEPTSPELEPEMRARLTEYYTIEGNLLLDSLLAAQKGRIRESAPHAINLLYQATVTLLLGLLFSFLVLVDIDRLMAQVQGLQASRLQDFYEEAAQPVVRFSYVVGRALQAQAMIALMNTSLTAVGLALLKIPLLTVLSLIVFVCGFVPVLGTFISTTPIVLVALNVGGLDKAAAVVALIAVVHLVEAYLLNPLIVGRHLNLNPVLVLMILFVGYHAFGIWGMVLGVPVVLYILHDVLGVPLTPPHPTAES